MPRELYSAHWDELQIWAVRSRPPFGRGLRHWLGFAFGLVIRAFTLRYGARYAHLLLRRGETIWEATASGVREGFATDYCREFYVLDVYTAPLEPEEEARAVDWARRSVGLPYDWAQLVRIGLRELGHEPDLFFIPDLGPDWLICSEFVALAYRQAGLDLCGDTPLWRWTPDHVHRAWREGRLERRGRLQWAEAVAADPPPVPAPA